MTMLVLVAVAVVVAPALIPSVALAGVRPVALFLAPLLGGVLAGTAAVGELAIGGGLVGWFVALAALANASALVSMLRRGAGRRRSEHPASGWRQPAIWAMATVAVVAAAAALPFAAMRVAQIGYDTLAIWVPHTLFLAAGHGPLVRDLRSAAYGTRESDYPPLIPAAAALVIDASGRSAVRVEDLVATVLNASGLAVLGCGLAQAVESRSRPPVRLLALVGAAVVVLAGFGLAGVFGVDGYADLAWASAASAAVVFGLVLPRTGANLAVACATAGAAALTKNEGLTTALIIMVLVAVRHAGSTREPQAAESASSRRAWRAWTWSTWSTWWRTRLAPWGRRLGLVLVATGPGLAWAFTAAALGIGVGFFSGRPPGPVPTRLQRSVVAIAREVHWLPVVALAVAVVGSLFLGRARRSLDLARAGWLWVVLVASSAVLVLTYGFGAYSLTWWFSTSLQRTTIFLQLLAVSELLLWGLVAVSALDALRARRETGPPEEERLEPRASELLTTEAPTASGSLR